MRTVLFAILAGSLVVLVIGAEALVRGASKIAIGAGLSPLVVGLTVVALGTSAPELAVSIGSSLSGQADLALGNVIGSNISNVLLILGASALVAPLVVNRQVVRLDVPIGLLAAVLALLAALDGRIGRLDGLLLTAGIVGYITFQIVQARSERTRGATETRLVGATFEAGGPDEQESERVRRLAPQPRPRRRSGLPLKKWTVVGFHAATRCRCSSSYPTGDW